MTGVEHDRLTTAESVGEDRAFDRAIRPQKLEDYKGQPNVSEQMGVFIEALAHRATVRRNFQPVFKSLDHGATRLP